MILLTQFKMIVRETLKVIVKQEKVMLLKGNIQFLNLMETYEQSRTQLMMDLMLKLSVLKDMYKK